MALTKGYMSQLRRGERFQFRPDTLLTWNVFCRYVYSQALRLGYFEYFDSVGRVQRVSKDLEVYRW